jgi:hypothetical protein
VCQASAALLVLGAFLWLGFGRRAETPLSAAAGAPPSSTPISQMARHESRPTLDPALFVGKAAASHRVARDIPDVLDQLYCYCRCDKQLGHKSLLSCYTDGHAAT